ncbi:hypothetical protein AGMMS50293_16200 [Spirochaetia bacterium]|nr:hypothetical protein AGMMS50293_16200 [Spirochaetia bacterium]
MTGLIVLIVGAFLFAVFGVIGLLIKTSSLAEENRRLSERINDLAEQVSWLKYDLKAGTPLAETAALDLQAAQPVSPGTLPETHCEPPEAEAVREAEQFAANLYAAPAEPAAPAGQVAVSAPAANAAALTVNTAESAGMETAAEHTPVLPETLQRFIKSGNFWAAGGVALLIAGFASLITYLARRGFFTVEMGIAAASLTGLAMLVTGWIFRKKRPGYCLLLQGGGIGILYLSIFAAHKLTPWFPPVMALVLLSVLIVPALILALVQNSQVLAIFGFIGGFAAPLLIVSGEGNHVFLFSYYTVLSLGVFVIGLFRFWRGLNLLAFACTFCSALYWVSTSYRSELFWSSEPFFIGYILIFTILGIHGFGKKALQRDAYFDSALLLCTPLLGAILQWRVFSFIPHGHALISVIFAAFYLLLSVFIWKRKGDTMRLFAEGYLGIAALLANLAIPLELAPRITSAVWAAEGTLFYFFGLRLKNTKLVISALALHIAAAIAFALDESVRNSGLAADLFRSPAFSGSVVIALAAMVLIIVTRKFREGRVESEGFFSVQGIYHRGFFVGLMLWFYAWWFSGWFAEFRRVFPSITNAYPFDFTGIFFLFCSATALAVFFAAKLIRCPSLLLGIIPSSVFAAGLLLFAITKNAMHIESPLFLLSHNFFHGLYVWGWIAFFAVHGTLITLIKLAPFVKKDLKDGLWGTWLFILILIAAAVLSSSGRALTLYFKLAPSWKSFAGLLPLFAAMICLSVGQIKLKETALTTVSRKLIFLVLPIIFSCILGLWFLVTLFLSGDPAPLPLYIPVLNPLDLLEAFSILIFLFWQASLRKTGSALKKRTLFVIIDMAIFLFVITLLGRSMHFYAGIPYYELFASDAYQLGLFAIWALYGIAHIIAGTRLSQRGIWIAGAVLTVTDIAKLLLLDLAGVDTVIRIISFFAAGLLLLFIGWISPLPPALKKESD